MDWLGMAYELIMYVNLKLRYNLLSSEVIQNITLQNNYIL